MAKKRKSGKDIVLAKNTFNTKTGDVPQLISSNPMMFVHAFEKNITRGIGPTYLSKVLRFSFPQEYGAIDTRCVRVFGLGDPETNKHEWLSLKARNDGYGWYIPRNQSAWPSEYGTWIDILRYFTGQLPSNCPHPARFIEAGLRSNNAWTCADVETALFSYASQFT